MATSLQTSSGVQPLHQASQGVPVYEAVYAPQASDAYTPPLDIALRLAREDLAAQQVANIHDHEAMIRATVRLEIRLRLLLAALDADGIGCAAADAKAVAA